MSRIDRIVCSAVADVLEIDGVNAAQRFDELGADTTHMCDIMLTIEGELGVEFSCDEFVAAETVGDIIGLCGGKDALQNM